MLTTQVQELTRDLTELIRKHQGRDLTRTEIVRQLATEGCVLVEEKKGTAELALWRLLGTAVTITASLPQTVDKPERIDPASPFADEKRRSRTRQWLRDVLGIAAFAFEDELSDREIALALLREAAGVLMRADTPSAPNIDAAKLVEEVREKLLAADEMEAA